MLLTVFVFAGTFLVMFHTATGISLLLLTLLATLNLGRSWVEEGINEQFYSLSAVDFMGQSIPMSSYTGKVMWHCVPFP